MHTEEVRSAALIAASFQASSPAEAIDIAKLYEGWIRGNEVPEGSFESVVVDQGGEMTEDQIEATRRANVAAAAERKQRREDEKLAIRGEE